MAGRGRPRKNEALERAAAESKQQMVSYGHLKEEQDRKKVKVEQTDGIERQKVSERQVATKHIPDRARKALEGTVKEIKEDIQSHKDCIKTIQKEIEQHNSCIKTHEQAIEELTAELKEEERFLAEFG